MFSGKAWTAKTGLLDQGFMYNSNWGGVKSELFNFEKWDLTMLPHLYSDGSAVEL